MDRGGPGPGGPGGGHHPGLRGPVHLRQPVPGQGDLRGDLPGDRHPGLPPPGPCTWPRPWAWRPGGWPPRGEDRPGQLYRELREILARTRISSGPSSSRSPLRRGGGGPRGRGGGGPGGGGAGVPLGWGGFSKPRGAAPVGRLPGRAPVWGPSGPAQGGPCDVVSPDSGREPYFLWKKAGGRIPGRKRFFLPGPTFSSLGGTLRGPPFFLLTCGPVSYARNGPPTSWAGWEGWVL